LEKRIETSQAKPNVTERLSDPPAEDARREPDERITANVTSASRQSIASIIP